MRAGGQQGWTGARLVVPLSAQRTLGKATTPRPGCPVADPRDTARYRQAGGPRPHPLQSKTKRHPTHSTEPRHTATCTLPHTPAWAFSRTCPEPVLNGCLPNSPTQCVCLGGKSGWVSRSQSPQRVLSFTASSLQSSGPRSCLTGQSAGESSPVSRAVAFTLSHRPGAFLTAEKSCQAAVSSGVDCSSHPLAPWLQSVEVEKPLGFS